MGRQEKETLREIMVIILKETVITLRKENEEKKIKYKESEKSKPCRETVIMTYL